LAPLISYYPYCHTAKKEIIRTKQRLREQEYSDYDFRVIYRAVEDAPLYLNNVTFASNVEVQALKGYGRSLFTTKDVITRELLLYEKAFFYCSLKHSKTSLLINTYINRATLDTQADLITATV